MIPIDVLVRKVTSDDIFEKALDVLETVKIPARSWRDGGVAKSVLGVLADFGAQAANHISAIVGGFFLYYAEGDYLSAHALDIYDVERIPATFATGQVTLYNTRSIVQSAGANQLIVRSSNTGARFRVTQAWSLPVGTVSVPGTVTVDVSAVESGAESTVATAEIDELETTISGVSVANLTPIIGRDAEGDEALRKRCLLKKGAWSPFGPRDAYEYAALSATLLDGTPTSINRVAVSRYSSVGTVTVVCATPTGTPTTDELDAVRRECERIARPDSVTLFVAGAVQRTVSNVATLWAKGGTESLLKADADNALRAFYASYPIGGIAKTEGGQGYLYLDKVAAVLIASSIEAFDVDFTGGADSALAPNEVATDISPPLVVRIR